MSTRADRWTWSGGALALAVALLALAGCNKDERFGLKFSHSTHVVDAEMACASCHGPLTGKGFQTPDHEACTECHKDEVESDKMTQETCGMCHKVKNLDDISATPPVTGVSRGVFVHTAALSNLCQTCHGQLLRPGQDFVPPMTRTAILGMRTRAHALKMACDACHLGMDPTVMPASHDVHWTRRHGMQGEQEGELCSTCHSEQSCRECHQTMEPQSHNTQWRLVTHGIQAGWDRQRCQTCHEPDFCTSCHAEVSPRSHSAGWEQRHCYQCHSSSGAGTGCAVCHEASIESHPNPHAAGWQSRHCTTCHAGSAEEQQCRLCHPGNVAEHVNPHSAGWSTRHCTTCHAGSNEEQTLCRQCHPGTIDDHVNPHGAGWSTRHCNNCHAGTPEEVFCRQCHPGTLGTHVNPHAAGYRDRHCYTCHEGAQAETECAVCHEGGSDLILHQSFWPERHNLYGTRIDCHYCHFP